MRKWNRFISLAIIMLFLIHGIAGAWELFGVLPGGNSALKILAWFMAGLIFVHIATGTVLTVQTLRAQKKAGVSYWSNNLWFWVRRISGFAMILLIVWHILIFSGSDGEAFRLRMFAGAQLAGSFLLALTIGVHIVSNIKPLLVALGTGQLYRFVRDIMVVLSVVLLFAGAAFVFYYLRWNVFWR